MIDARLLRAEAVLLLAGDDLRASTMVVHPHARALDGLTATFTGSDGEDGSGSSGAAFDEELAAAVAANYAQVRWLQKVMPSDDVQPIPFPSFFLSRSGRVEYQTMPWFSIQLIRRAELAAARGEWCEMLGMTQAEYDEAGRNPRVAKRRHAVNAAAPALTELFLEVRRGDLPRSGAEKQPAADAGAWRQAAQRCAEREALRWSASGA
jgi:hypothetical protein